MNELVKGAIRNFWSVRNGGTGVLGGKTLDGFINLISQVIESSRLECFEIHTGKNTSQLPGYFRPHKSWDIVVTSNGHLVAAVELKSQVGSIGNNFNNRTEEVLGSGLDLSTAIEENAFLPGVRPFMGYLILVEDSDTTRRSARISMDHFPVMTGFLADERCRGTNYQPINGKYPRAAGVSYLKRYDILCRKLMAKRIYDAASVVAASRENSSSGEYRNLSGSTSVNAFIQQLTNHCNLFADFSD
ncbi:PaeR7I family type II restriction endonuclease [Photobacterium damselae]|uniref:PaeR7I family type II restriction endonuclease n=1 Tax=Photobacterium damselae TaxID=38293 RepID=UPI000D07F301|nr:PaeR7I family type II restriction endonuclease [Photobacterium damselae]PSB85495.1 restriction endonuclease [Photobacterium damselae subsp. damselae]SUB91739.1 Type-2 restriction enzyme PaeR7I [Photobacterium damselae]